MVSDFHLKVKETGAKYGMGMYTNEELWAIATGLEPENFDGNMKFILNDPCMIKGIGKRRKMIVLSVKELIKRLSAKSEEPVTIHGPEDVANFVIPNMRYLTKEEFRVIPLDTKNHVLGMETISVGGLSSSIVHPREVFEVAIRYHAASIILIHNHPSCDPTPSREDIKVTKRLCDSGKIMDVVVLDHIIIGGDDYVSLKDNGSIN